MALFLHRLEVVVRPFLSCYLFFHSFFPFSLGSVGMMVMAMDNDGERMKRHAHGAEALFIPSVCIC